MWERPEDVMLPELFLRRQFLAKLSSIRSIAKEVAVAKEEVEVLPSVSRRGSLSSLRPGSPKGFNLPGKSLRGLPLKPVQLPPPRDVQEPAEEEEAVIGVLQEAMDDASASGSASPEPMLFAREAARTTGARVVAPDSSPGSIRLETSFCASNPPRVAGSGILRLSEQPDSSPESVRFAASPSPSFGQTGKLSLRGSHRFAGLCAVEEVQSALTDAERCLAAFEEERRLQMRTLQRKRSRNKLQRDSPKNASRVDFATTINAAGVSGLSSFSRLDGEGLWQNQQVRSMNRTSRF